VYLLDTDTISLIVHYAEQHPALVERVLATPHEQLAISIITVEESLRGIFDLIHRDRNTPRVVQRYEFFQRTLIALGRFRVVSYDDASEAAFQAIPAKVRQRSGTQDCRIAATAIARRYTVVTRNTPDFERIPGAHCEDWTLATPE
jgi:tRNA(fMet)-specific endonuclease VapC